MSKLADRLAFVAIMVAAVLSATAVAEKSVTVDEFQALPHGLAILRTGDFRLATTAQPLSQVLPALPLWFSSARLDRAELARQESRWGVGGLFMRENRDGYQDYFLAGRMVCVIVLIITCVCAWRLSRRLYGSVGGLLTAVIAGLCPDLLAHGALITPDIFLAAPVIGFLWALDVLVERSSLAAGVALGLTIGAACLAKHTGLLLIVICPLAILAVIVGRKRAEEAIFGMRQKPSRARSIWLAAALALPVCLLVINAGYMFQNSFTMLGQYRPVTAEFRAIQSHLPGWLRIPLPYAFFQGADEQLADKGYEAYLCGQFNDAGFYSYYLVALLVKVPGVVWGMALLALIGALRVSRREMPVVLCGIGLLAFFSMTRHKNIGVRYVLFLEPMLAIWIGRLAKANAWQAPRLGRCLKTAIGCGLCWLFAVALWSWPDYLAYFNAPAGGPAKGHEYLLDSNLDWGQDLTTLKRYMDKEAITSIDLAYFGRVNPKIYGINYRHLGFQPPGRYVAISANFLWGRMYFMNGTSYWPPNRDAFWSYHGRQPRAILGFSIYVFDLGAFNQGKSGRK